MDALKLPDIVSGSRNILSCIIVSKSTRSTAVDLTKLN